MFKVEGVLPALITPFGEDGKVDAEGIQRLVEFVEKGGVNGIVPSGTTGESATLSLKEHIEVIDLVVDAAKTLVVAGTGSNCTGEALNLTSHAKDSGADAALLVVPYYNKPNTKGLIKHYTTLADRVDLPQIIYNIASRTGINMSVDALVELAEHPNIVGVKEASGDLNQVSEIFNRTIDEDFIIYSGDDSLTLPIMAVGGRGVISVAANVAPAECCKMVEAVLSGDFAGALERHITLFPFFDSLFLETNPIPVKKAAELMGLCSGSMRLPLAEISPENEELLKSEMIGMGILSD